MLEVDERAVGPQPLTQLLASDQIPGSLEQLDQHLECLVLQADAHTRLAQFTRMQIQFEAAESERPAHRRGDFCHRHTLSEPALLQAVQ